jgi:hypothetical protein
MRTIQPDLGSRCSGAFCGIFRSLLPNPFAACSLDTNKLPPAPKCTPIVVPATSTSFDSRQQKARGIAPHEARSFPPHATTLMTNSVIMSLRKRCTAVHWPHSPPPHPTGAQASGCGLRALIVGDELLGRLEQLAQTA